MRQVHDRGYKRLFSNRQFFQQLLETFVNEAWVKDIDFEHCEKIDKTFITEHYKETESDILYKVSLKGQETYIYVLIEFQSSVVWFMALRMLHYICSFWLDYIEQHPKARKLPAIFPILLYSGDKKWRATTDLHNLLQNPELFKEYLPHFRYFKIAENEYSQQQLLSIGNLVSTLFLAETADDIDKIKNQLLNLFEKSEDKAAISLLLNWYQQLVVHGYREQVDYQALEQIYREQQEVNVMLETALNKHGQRFFIQGEQIGIQKGEQIGFQKGFLLLLESKFGKLNAQQKTRLEQLNDQQLTNISKKLWTASSLEEIFLDL